MIMLITANLKSAKGQASFHDIIRTHAPVWWHYLDATWLVKTDDPPSEWIKWLRPGIDEVDDSIFITKIDGTEYSGWLPHKAFEWIKNNR